MDRFDFTTLNVVINVDLPENHDDYITHNGYNRDIRSSDNFESFTPPLDIFNHCCINYKHSGLLPECFLKQWSDNIDGGKFIKHL